MLDTQSNASELFNEILHEALRHGIIDIFTVISYWSNGTSSDDIVRDLQNKLRAQRSLFV